ncbi:MAG TPA: ATP-binding protein [Candidatus Dormibacteraeota bacterium]|nr:ATP-binding protein [Candidatus Dormibacteraeota bacterium]
MATDISAPPFTLDVRVARSPLVGLRYSVDGRATDIDDLIERLEAAHSAAEAERKAIKTQQKPYAANHKAMVQRLTRGSAGYRQHLEEDLELRAALARIDEQMACLRGRIEALREQRATLREVSSSLAGIDTLGEASIDGPGAAANQAVRQLFHLIDIDHDSTARRIFEGPMQLLADAALHTELIGRVVTDDGPGASDGAAKCRRSTDAALRELQSMVFRLHPEELHEDGLVPSVRRLVSDLASGARAQVMVLGNARRLRPGVEMAIFRIVQEAMANAVAQGHARSVEVSLLFQSERVAAVVLDDGEGFDVAATEARLGRSTGLGLLTMRQRAEIEGGLIDIRSLVGEGTEVRVTFPDPD